MASFIEITNHSSSKDPVIIGVCQISSVERCGNGSCLKALTYLPHYFQNSAPIFF